MVGQHVPPDKVGETTDVLWDMRKLSVKLAQTFDQLSEDYDTSLETWLEKTTYTTKDKDKFRREVDEQDFIIKRDRACKCFIKAETYTEYKHARPIKSRTDRFKAKMGPIFQGINEVLFSRTEYFIKKVPVYQRPQIIKELFGNSDNISCTDFSSFEAHFIDCLMFAIELPFYRWVTYKLPTADWFWEELNTLLLANICKFVDFILECMSRASGEMNTSSGNGYVNLVLFIYVCCVKKAREAKAQFEGDDSVNSAKPDNSTPTSQDYTDLGWVCKLQKVSKVEEASFCGMVSDPDDLINVCDIKAYIADFGWTRQQYLGANNTTIMALIRAKGYSAIYQYPGCPVIDAMGHYAIRITNHQHVQNRMMRMYRSGSLADSRYKNDKFTHIFERMKLKIPERKQSPNNTRELVERMFGIQIQQQIDLEKYFDQATEIKPMDFDFDVPLQWEYNTEMFVSHEYIHDVSFHFESLIRDLKTVLDEHQMPSL
jgi:hypothetical protein